MSTACALQLLLSILELHAADVEVVVEVNILLRMLTLDDDVRVAFGKAHDHAKLIAKVDRAGHKPACAAPAYLA